ncbi:MAG: FAD-dependent oxidoreductase, partial [Polyangiaceae bacterium]|nr:FAD-dependent oxidoreductase [Polyangiaceae bacterium]
MTLFTTQVLIIGGGATGTGLARDLALRNVQCLLVDQRDVDAGASGANHGLLHSGARYVSGDAESASHCREEGSLLKALAPQCVEDTKGLFVAVQGDDERYIADFGQLCAKCGIPAREITPQRARELEPSLSPRVIAAYEVDDATVDPFKLALDNIAQAQALGSKLLTHTRVVGFEARNRRIEAACLVDTRTGEQHLAHAAWVVNAAGAWSGEVAAMAGLKLCLLFSKGTLVITHNRLTHRVVNRLRKPSNADIIVPG